MFNAAEENRLYDFVNELEIEVNLSKKKREYDLCQFLDDVSRWMDKNRSLITDNYFPLAIIAVGGLPSQVSAFLYGLLIGKTIEKNKLSINVNKKKLTYKEILEKMEEGMKKYSPLFDDISPGKPKEKPNDDPQNTRK